MGEFICFEQPDLFKPIQSVIAVLVLISLGSASAVDGSGVLWFIALSSLTISTLATILLMFNKDGMSGRNIHFADGILPWNVIEFVYSSILTLLCGIALWISFGYASHVDIDGHSAGYVFAGIFLILQMACYAIPVFILYNRIQSAKEQHEPIAEVNPFGFRNGDEERYQNQTV